MISFDRGTVERRKSCPPCTKTQDRSRRRPQAEVSEKEAQIAGMQRQIEALRRKAQQGFQQLQGGTQVFELESLIRAPLHTTSFGSDTSPWKSARSSTCGTVKESPRFAASLFSPCCQGGKMEPCWTRSAACAASGRSRAAASAVARTALCI
ncbi:hypothetical protein B5V03_31705 [Bradyrhizobium betae]|uniref:Uncharacterized protein n=1 Tax=Bradyrhizobium betae TaxID=244734 RepID=A0A4Q1USM7_9BRAD|nr:hypothetical protein B5V03_31705 [Bradyrhizobium betae]